ncbi:uncharacterized protein NDAI_0G05690 [Naumovozyma dairenensis CBS 421]|uniref:Spindle pole body component SPC42 n=1 Tax=Naumovozyma dairenensis (strain ATCC 10597 / BCRC 20456 / CBS 421 / NBRC 0211 / NRRL Y-12639) TaxID=1071378 RepID=J7RTI5_NAUDC|nr:hypothetical protein NDAI_0G05690 [Naumovozyma dairenensis CBS 421]CCK73552.1 hypothetical protein NDAI_0G05690 [Naumovozyma dairenensis CBS 421]
MPISPSPKRYTSFTHNINNDNNVRYNPDHQGLYGDRRHYSDIYPPRSRGGIGLGRSDANRIIEPKSYQDDILLPEEVKLSSRRFDELIKQNKDLKMELNRKNDEIDKWTILSSSLKTKLIKYTRLHEQDLLKIQSLNDEIQSLTAQFKLDRNDKNILTTPHLPPPSQEEDPLEKNVRNDDDDDEEIAESDRNEKLLRKIELLTDIIYKNQLKDRLEAATHSETVNDSNSHNAAPKDELLKPQQSQSQNKQYYPTEETILSQESFELKTLEEQIEKIKHRLSIKQENEQRKISLNKELRDLMLKLEPNSTIPASNMAHIYPANDLTRSCSSVEEISSLASTPTSLGSVEPKHHPRANRGHINGNNIKRKPSTRVEPPKDEYETPIRDKNSNFSPTKINNGDVTIDDMSL